MMKPARRQRLQMILLLLVCISVAVGLILYALQQNINLFVTPTELVTQPQPLHRSLKLGGMVALGSVVRLADGVSVEFTLTDYHHSVRVHYRGILPDLFREGQGIVTQGELVAKDDFRAEMVLAKHDNNYRPKVLQKLIQQVNAT